MKKVSKLDLHNYNILMNLKDLAAINRDPEFTGTWLSNQKTILSILTLGGIAIVMSWNFLEQYYPVSGTPNTSWLRWGTSLLYLINLAVALWRNNPLGTRQHIVAGFYFGTMFCTLQAILTGASQSPYWYSLFFIIVAWFILVPYNFIAMVGHSIAFVSIYIVGLYSQSLYEIVPAEMARIGLLYSGTLFISFFAAYIRNRLDAENFLFKKELKEKNRELKKFRLVLDQAPGAVFIMDKHWNFTYLNPAFTRLSGFNAEELLNKNIRDTLYHGIVDIPESRKEVSNYLMEGKSWQGELQTIHKNGTKYWANTIASPFENESGEIEGYIMIQQDITEHKNFEKALRESEEKYRNLIEKATDGVVITQQGLIKFVNPSMCLMLGYQAEELLGKAYTDFTVPEDQELMNEYHKRRMAGISFTSIYRSRLIRKDGNILTVELNARTSDFEGSPAAFIIIRDITERLSIEIELKKAKEELEILNRDLGKRVEESSQRLTEVNTQLINLQKENLQSQFEVLRQQVNPHFLFNSLNVLTSLIKLDPDLAEKFTEHLSKVYRYVLENKDNDLVPLDTELEFLVAYMFLLHIRFMDKIEIEVNIDEEKKQLLILPLALQLLIENAIKHNAMSKKKPLRIVIFLDNNDVLNVVNNLQERESHMASTGVGLKNIEHRYKLLEMPSPSFEKTETSFIARIPLKK